jgi:hypothetical protein
VLDGPRIGLSLSLFCSHLMLCIITAGIDGMAAVS